ncbi:MAG: flagellar hook-basal body complex protein FliE [Rhizobiaceae bacterium]
MIDPVTLAGIGGTQATGLAAPAATKPEEASGIGGFGEVLAATSRHMLTDLASAENLSMQALQGKGETREVVDAVMSAERSLQIAIAIRDKIVTAYLEVSRMQI